MFSFLLVVQVLVSVSIIALVMLQHGKGADMGSGFGGGASSTVFGSVGSGNFLTRTTTTIAIAFPLIWDLPWAIVHPWVEGAVRCGGKVAARIG